jgi:DNA-binding XRE family transcriptional regulator
MNFQTLKLGEKEFVVIDRSEFDRLLDRAHELPPLPKPDADGNVPAVAYARASLARKLILQRLDARLTQKQLAGLAGVRMETISRLETGKHTPDLATLDKIDKALNHGARNRPSARASTTKRAYKQA